MLILKELITLEHQSEYESAYDLSLNRNFSNPKIYTAKGDLTKRWYVYFSFRDPKTDKLKRLTPFYGNTNKYKTKEERLEVLTVYRKTLLRLLKQGYNPFSDNTELYQTLNSKKETTEQEIIQVPKEETTMAIVKEEPKITLRDAFDFGLKLKEKLVSERTKKDYESKINVFLKWIGEKYPTFVIIDTLNKKIITEFLNHVLVTTSARNRNNYRTDLSSILQVLDDNDIVDANIIKKIPVLKSIPKRNRTYTLETQEAIFEYLAEKDPMLLLYIKFISYAFLRPLEVCRLKVKNIHLNNRTIQFKAKNNPFKIKIIPNILFDELPDLSSLNQDDALFTPDQIGGVWDTHEDNKRDYFTKRYKKVVKDHFKFGVEYGLYSFRHTYITKLYRGFVKDSNPYDAKSRLMQITGHTTMSALEKYLRDIDAELPPDFSEML